jgi:hypothetical protein
LVGEILPEIGQLVNLTELDLSRNQLEGQIPTQLASLVNLRRLNLADNRIAGSIPAEFNQLVNLQTLRLEDNLLTGSIPELSGLILLRTLHLQNNGLTGEVPVSLTSLTELSDFGVVYNMLTASDESVVALLDRLGPEWRATQTVPPSNIEAIVTTHTIELRWVPILYVTDGGSYEIRYASTAGGPYTLHGVTEGKSANHYVVGDLPSGNTYYFVIRTYTPAHGRQNQDLLSDYTAEIAVSY